jgi:hypothetical protein
MLENILQGIAIVLGMLSIPPAYLLLKRVLTNYKKGTDEEKAGGEGLILTLFSAIIISLFNILIYQEQFTGVRFFFRPHDLAVARSFLGSVLSFHVLAIYKKNFLDNK